MATFNGTDFNDTYAGTEDADQIDGNGGDDDLKGNGGNDTINGGSGNDTIQGGAGQDTLDGGSDYDTVDYTTFNGNGVYDLGAGTANLGVFTEQILNFEGIIAGNGNDIITSPDSFGLNAFAGGGDDLVNGGASNDYIFGGDGNDTLNSNGGDDIIQGDAGNDIIQGGAGNDTLRGDAGNDTINGGDDDDIIQGGLGLDTLNGGNGVDRADYTTFNGNGVYDLGTGTANLGVFTEQMLNFENIFTGSGNDTIYGSGANNTINGNAGNDILYGGAGNDIINGGDGIDFIQGGLGLDTLDGGNGKDTVDYTTFNGNGIYKLGTGMVGGIGAGTANLGVGVFTETMLNFENINTGAGDDRIEGDFGDNIIYAGAGNDTIVDRVLGNNTIYGEAGNDNITGGLGDDKLYGGDGSDTIDGLDGNDYIQGGLGNDTLDGGNGIDQVDYTTFNGGGIYNLMAGTADLTGAFIEQMKNFEVIYTGAGNDTIYATSLGAISQVYAGAGNDIIVGGEQSDLIYGEAGDDIINGGSGNDYIQGGLGQDYLDGGGGGSDTVDYNTFNGNGIYDLVNGTANLGAFTEVMLNFESISTGAGNDTIYGTGTENDLDGRDGNDTIYGRYGDDQLYGGAGDDQLYGEAGDDLLTGGAGSDNFYFGGTALSGSNTVANSIGRDRIYDFTQGQDEIVLSKTAFTNMTTFISIFGIPIEVLNFGTAINDAAAATSTAAIVYSKGTGNLFYNPNGTATGFNTSSENGGNFAFLGLSIGTDLAFTDLVIVA